VPSMRVLNFLMNTGCRSPLRVLSCPRGLCYVCVGAIQRSRRKRPPLRRRSTKRWKGPQAP
jgi:hypothetical protein